MALSIYFLGSFRLHIPQYGKWKFYLVEMKMELYSWIANEKEIKFILRLPIWKDNIIEMKHVKNLNVFVDK